MSEPFDRGHAAGEPFEPALGRFNDDPAMTSMGPFVPIVILALVLLFWFGFQTYQLRIEHDAIRDTAAAQAKRIDDSTKLLAALDALARGTNQLADGGNPNAKLIVDELKKRGITIQSDPSADAATQAPVGKP